MDSSIGFVGTHQKTGDTHIVVSSGCPFWMVYSEHKLATWMHEVIASRTHIMVASKTGTDRVLEKHEITSISEQYESTLGPHECLVGVYNKGHCGKARQKFKIKIKGPDCSLISSFDVSHA